MKKLKVNQDVCIGCSLCTQICPNVFEINDEGKVDVINPKGDSEDKIQSAIDSCPVKGLSWEE